MKFSRRGSAPPAFSFFAFCSPTRRAGSLLIYTKNEIERNRLNFLYKLGNINKEVDHENHLLDFKQYEEYEES